MERMESIVTKRTNPTTEVSEKPARRRFTAEYRLRILAEAEARRLSSPPSVGQANQENVGFSHRAIILGGPTSGQRP